MTSAAFDERRLFSPRAVLHHAAMLDAVGPGSLKLVVACDDSAVVDVLREHVLDAHIRPAGDTGWLIFTEAEPSTIRDWLVAALPDEAQVFVVEFEHWSGHGDIDGPWLLRRGH